MDSHSHNRNRQPLFCIALYFVLFAACGFSGCIMHSDHPGNSEPGSAAASATDTAGGKQHTFYHYSLWAALVNKAYDGDLTVKEARTKGDIGLGTYNGTDGELVLVDGTFYQVPSSGEVKLATDTMEIPYLNATFFHGDSTFELDGDQTYDEFRKRVQEHFPSRNYFYAFKIHGNFDSLKLGSLYHQEKPYQEGLDSLMPHRPHFFHTNLKGTMIGFWCPDYIGDINVAGFHLHFLSDDKKVGGHVMEFKGSHFDVAMEQLTAYHIALPQTEEFRNATLEKKYQYGKK